MNKQVKKQTRVLVVDDSALMRKLLIGILSEDPEIEVVDAVSDALQARTRIKELNPDVITLDVEMPLMNGIEFLEKLMQLRPMPVVMISAITQRGADTTMKALMLGAVDFVGKPNLKSDQNIDSYAATVCRKVKAAGRARMPGQDGPAKRIRSMVPCRYHDNALIAIGASTGGVEAIYNLIRRMPATMPPILITQHIPPVFSTSFARRLDERVDISIREAADGTPILPGNVYIAPGDRHLTVTCRNGKRICRLTDGPRVNRHIPSVDVLFQSVAKQAGSQGIGVLLTGMGEDGARGLGEMQSRGANTIAQDEQTSVVWGMPGAAVAMGAARHVLPLHRIPNTILALLEENAGIRQERKAQ